MSHTPYTLELSFGLPAGFEWLAESAQSASSLFPHATAAVQGLALAAQKRWLEYASGTRPLPDGRTLHRVSGGYASSIRIEEDGELRYVLFSDDPKADWIERGFPAWDMHSLLGTSNKVRTGKNGKRYLIIPFGHKTSGGLGVTMPQQAQNFFLAPGRRSSVVTGHYTETGGQGVGRVTRNTYLWGDRLSAGDVSQMGLDPDGAGRNLVGMVRFQNETDKGGRYLTFRVLSEGSSGWQMPARPGYKPAEATHQFILEHHDKLMKLALDEDLERLSRIGESP